MQELIEVQENFINLDIEMSFVEQEDVFKVVETLLIKVYLKNFHQKNFI